MIRGYKVMYNLTINDLEKLFLSIHVIEPNGCWLYQPYIKDGYDSLCLEGRPKQRARDLVYEIFNEKIPDNIKVFTTCKNKFCVNPNHVLFISSDEDRFWSYVNKKSDIECWEWFGSISKYGYGEIKIGQKVIKAHRLSWNIHKGNIPDGLLICHKCDNKKCVNPSHLFLGTYMDNNRDRDNKDRAIHQSGENHGRAKLTQNDVDTIRTLRAENHLSQYELARMFLVTRPTIKKILDGVTWRQ